MVFLLEIFSIRRENFYCFNKVNGFMKKSMNLRNCNLISNLILLLQQYSKQNYQNSSNIMRNQTSNYNCSLFSINYLVTNATTDNKNDQEFQNNSKIRVPKASKTYFIVGYSHHRRTKQRNQENFQYSPIRNQHFRNSISYYEESQSQIESSIQNSRQHRKIFKQSENIGKIEKKVSLGHSFSNCSRDSSNQISKTYKMKKCDNSVNQGRNQDASEIKTKNMSIHRSSEDYRQTEKYSKMVPYKSNAKNLLKQQHKHHLSSLENSQYHQQQYLYKQAQPVKRSYMTHKLHTFFDNGEQIQNSTNNLNSINSIPQAESQGLSKTSINPYQKNYNETKQSGNDSMASQYKMAKQKIKNIPKMLKTSKAMNQQFQINPAFVSIKQNKGIHPHKKSLKQLIKNRNSTDGITNNHKLSQYYFQTPFFQLSEQKSKQNKTSLQRKSYEKISRPSSKNIKETQILHNNVYLNNPIEIGNMMERSQLQNQPQLYRRVSEIPDNRLTQKYKKPQESTHSIQIEENCTKRWKKRISQGIQDAQQIKGSGISEGQYSNTYAKTLNQLTHKHVSSQGDRSSSNHVSILQQDSILQRPYQFQSEKNINTRMQILKRIHKMSIYTADNWKNIGKNQYFDSSTSQHQFKK